MEELIVHLEFGKVIAITSAIVIIITIITDVIFRKYSLVKYVPGTIIIIIGLFNLLKVGVENIGLDDFNRMFLVLITLITGFIGICTGLIIGIIRKDKR